MKQHIRDIALWLVLAAIMGTIVYFVLSVGIGALAGPYVGY